MTVLMSYTTALQFILVMFLLVDLHSTLSEFSSIINHAESEAIIHKTFIQNEDQVNNDKLYPPVFEEVLKDEIRDPCQTAEILEQPWRHWTYDDNEVPVENGRKKYECDAHWLPLRRWFGFSVNGIRSEIMHGHVKSHRCGTVHPLSISFDISLLFQQSMLYPQLRSIQSSDERHDDDDNEYEDDEDDDDDDKFLIKSPYIELQGERITKNSKTTSPETSHSLPPTPPSSPSSSQKSTSGQDLLNKLQTTNESDFSSSLEDYFFSNHSFISSSNSSLLNVTNLLSNSSSIEVDDLSSTSTKRFLVSQTYSLPRYERIYDSIFESHSRRLFSYMLRDLDTIQELQQFLMLQQLQMNTSIISKELQESEILRKNINYTIDSLFSPELQDQLEEMSNFDNHNMSAVNISSANISDYYFLLKTLRHHIEEKNKIFKRKITVLSEEKQKLVKQKKTKLHTRKKNRRVAFLRQNYTVAQLCVYHRFLEKSSCTNALSVPIVIKKCPAGAVYWLEKMILRCPSGVCVKRINETASYEVFLNIREEVSMLKPLSQLIDPNLKSLVTIEFNMLVDNVDFTKLCSSLRPILAKKFKYKISTKSKYPRKFLKVKGKPTERNFTYFHKEEKFDGALIPDIDSDAAGPSSNDKRKKKIKRNAAYETSSKNFEQLKDDLEAWGGLNSLLRAPLETKQSTIQPAVMLENKNPKETEEELTSEDFELVKFVDYDPIVLDGKLRLTVFVDGNTSLSRGDILDAVKCLNTSGNLDSENMTLASLYPGFPSDISQLRAGGRAARFWQENKDMLMCAFVILGILSSFAAIYLLCRANKIRKKKELFLGSKRYNKSAQTDSLITGYIFGTSTPIVFFGTPGQGN